MEHADSQNNTHSNIDQMQKPTLCVSPHNPPTTAGRSPNDGPPWPGDEAVLRQKHKDRPPQWNGQGV